MRIHLRLSVSVVLLTVSVVEATTFQRTVDSNGTTLCAIAAPSLAIRIDQMASLPPTVGCAPVEVRCAWLCSRESNCTNYNYRKGLDQCEIFRYAPTNCSLQQGCSHHRVKGLKCCQNSELFPQCSTNTTSTGTVVHGETVLMTCSVSYSGTQAPSIKWRDSKGNVISNATSITTTDLVTSSILIPGYYPTVARFNCTASNFNTTVGYSCVTQNASVICPNGFQYTPSARSCYAVILVALNWTQARSSCQQLYSGAYLSIVSSYAENQAIASYLGTKLTASLDPTVRNFTFVGGQRLNPSCTSGFVWKPRDDVSLPVNYTNWFSGEPNCNFNTEFCLVIRPDKFYYWNDDGCYKTLWSLCECGPF